jgi:hypothetical protein
MLDKEESLVYIDAIGDLPEQNSNAWFTLMFAIVKLISSVEAPERP